MNPAALQPFVLPLALLGAAVMIAWRVRESRRAVTPKSLLIPPLGMSTGLFMFVVAPQTRVPLLWAAAALTVGAVVFALPLLWSSRLTRVGDQIVMQRSRAFLLLLLGLVAVRQILRTTLEQYIDLFQTGALFYLLAFGAIVRWRVQLWREYRALAAGPGAPGSAGPAAP